MWLTKANKPDEMHTKTEMSTKLTTKMSSLYGSLVTTVVDSRALSHRYTRLIPEWSDPGFRYAIKKCYRRIQSRSRRVFKTRLGQDEGSTNPVYDIQYSSAVYPSHRVVGVADENGFLNIVRVGVDDGRRSSNKRNRDGALDPRFTGVSVRGEDDDDNLHPVVYSVDWSSCGTKIATGYGNGFIRLWDFGNGEVKEFAKFKPYDLSIKRVAWRSDGSQTLVSCSRSSEIKIHDLRMRDPVVNSVDCKPLNLRLTDVCVLDDNYVVGCSSNSSRTQLWDMRNTYKLYKRIVPVRVFDVQSNSVCLKKNVYTDSFYCLGSDGVVRGIDWRNDSVFGGWVVPGGVDFFTRIDVDSENGVLVSGGVQTSCFGFDLKDVRNSNHLFELRVGGGFDDNGDVVDDKENSGNECLRCCSAVAVAKLNGGCDSWYQVATGGDDSMVTVWD